MILIEVTQPGKGIGASQRKERHMASEREPLPIVTRCRRSDSRRNAWPVPQLCPVNLAVSAMLFAPADRDAYRANCEAGAGSHQEKRHEQTSNHRTNRGADADDTRRDCRASPCGLTQAP